MGLSENRLNPIVPNGFADHSPVFKWLFHWGFGPHFQTYPCVLLKVFNAGPRECLGKQRCPQVVGRGQVRQVLSHDHDSCIGGHVAKNDCLGN